MPNSKSRHIGTHKNSMPYGSTDGVMTAAKTAIKNQMMRRFSRYESTLMMPRRFMKSMTSGVWNDRPKTTGIMIAKPSHSLSRRSGSRPIQSLNDSSTSIDLGMTKNSHSKTPRMNRKMLNGM